MYMYKSLLGSLLLFTALFGSTISGDENFDCFANHHRSHTSEFIGPVFDLSLAPTPLTEEVAVSFLGEAGPKTYRFGGTVGLIHNNNRFKFSTEQLGQDLQYDFSTGKVRRWVHQFAIGGTYQYFLCNDFVKSIDFDVTYSRAFNRNLRDIICEANLNSTTILFRTITGARNAHIGAGLTISPWECADLSLTADWDYTRYVQRYQCDDKSSGFGGTVRLFQRLPCNLNLNVVTEFRRPFNYYKASFGWGSSYECTSFDVNLYGSYTQARDNVPNVGTVGLNFNVAFGGGPLFKDDFFPCYFNQSPCCAPCFDPYASCCLQRVCDPELLAWVTEPAVYMPVVLAKASEAIVTFNNASPPGPTPPPPSTCPTIVELGAIPPIVFTAGGQTFNAGAFFTSTVPLIFVLDPVSPSFTIDAATGIITYTGVVPPVNPFNGSLIISTGIPGCPSVAVPLSILIQTGQCIFIELSPNFPPQINFANPGPSTFDISTFIVAGSAPITFSLTTAPPTAAFTINPATGVITYSGGLPDGASATLEITYANACSEVIRTTQYVILGGCIPIQQIQGIPDPIFMVNTIGSTTDLSIYFNTGLATPPLVYNVSGLPPEFSLNTSSGLLTYNGGIAGTPIIPISIAVSNPCNDLPAIPANIALTAGPGCIPPVWQPFPVGGFSVGPGPGSINFSTFIVPGATLPLTYSFPDILLVPPIGLCTFDTSTGILSYPGGGLGATTGPYTVTVTGCDAALVPSPAFFIKTNN